MTPSDREAAGQRIARARRRRGLFHRNDHGQPRGRTTPAGKKAAVLAVVVTIAKGYDLGYIWKTQDHTAQCTTGGYYLNAAQVGEPPGRWWGPGAQALGLTPGQTVHRQPYNTVYRQTDPRTGAKLGRPAAATPPSPTTWPGSPPPSRTPPPNGSSNSNAKPPRPPGNPPPITTSRSRSPSRSRCCTPRSGRTSAAPASPGTGRRPRTGPGGSRRFRRCCTGRTGPRWSTCRRGPGSPAPATTAPASTAASPAGSSPPG